MSDVMYAVATPSDVRFIVPTWKTRKGFTCSRCGLEVEVKPRYFDRTGPICRVCLINERLEEQNRRAHWVE